MNEQQEIKLKNELAKFFRTKFTYLGMTDEAKETRLYILVNEMFDIIMSNSKGGPGKLPTHIS